MIELKIELSKKSYLNTWNIFSKALIIKENLNKYEKILIIANKQKDIEDYKKVFNFLEQNISEILKESDLCNIILNKKWLFCTLEENCIDHIKNKNYLIKNSLYIKKGLELEIDNIIEKMNSLWYKYSEFLSSWTYKKYWDLIKIVDFNSSYILEISFWWNNIEDIRKTDLINGLEKRFEELEEFYIWWNSDIKWENKTNIIDLVNQEKVFSILDFIDFNKNYETLTNTINSFCSFDFLWNKNLEIEDLDIKTQKIDNLEDFKTSIKDKENKNFVFVNKVDTIKNFIDYNEIENVKVEKTNLSFIKSFKYKNINIIWEDIISKIFTRKRIKKNLSKELDLLLKISPWDLVVHIDHWIWIFSWIITKEIESKKKEYVEISYLWNDKLFVPITEVSRVNKYLWPENPKLTHLNTKEWENKIKKASEDAQKIANELIEIYSQRKISKWFSFLEFKEKEDEFQSKFPYTYTKDQIETIKDVFKDMSLEKSMDRLIVWDVWFWKTEIAFNAIYKAFLNKKQIAFISPLVVLAYEHYEKAAERFRWLWIKIWILTRLESSKNTNITIKKIKNKEIDLLIWTHKILSENTVFNDLWLLIVDEEHKFWVKDKEKIKKLKSNIDVLSMSATPIPRSLNMAMSSIRDISIIKTAPIWRKPIETIISKFNDKVIYDSCKKEFERWWQVFFIHNRVMNINHYKSLIEKLFPNKKVIVTHGRLEWVELENRIIDFKNKKYDVLLSTTVIENWIDFSNVNTIIINEATNFWISQIHQLRWRVWRSDKKWYCYLLYKNDELSDETVKRLKTIVEYNYLWAWFELALKDLEIRWWWDILGIRQSGQNSNIWLNTFLKMIEDKIEELSNTRKKEEKTITKIDLNIDIWVDDNYFSSQIDKINYYREIETIDDLESLNDIITDFENNNNKIDARTKNLFDLIKLKILALKHKITSIKKVWINYQIEFRENINIEELKEFLVLDKEVIFSIVSINKIRASNKKFKNDEEFMNYLINIIERKIEVKKKIKLKR